MVATIDAVRIALERDGFAILPGFLPPEPCEQLGAAIVGECDRLVEAGWKFVGGGRWEGNRDVIPGAAGIAVWDAAVASGLAEMVGAATGQTLAATALGGNLAMPGGRAQNFHIDGAFDTLSWVANIALTATDASNGMTALVPGSHRAELFRVPPRRQRTLGSAARDAARRCPRQAFDRVAAGWSTFRPGRDRWR